MKKILIAVIFAFTLTSPSFLSAASSEGIVRYAVIAGSNDGGRGTSNLKYAAGDAKKIHDLLTRFGGLKEENVMLLINPEKESLFQGLQFIKSKITKNRTSEQQVQFFFYYSGHADTKGLLLFGEHYGYTELKTAITSLNADVQVAVLDSCSSGAFTRDKGGEMAPPFLMDNSTLVEGHAYLTSSTAEEVSQESDVIESSFFTHALINGLRGAADANTDGKVTLNEAYEYAYNQTLRDTEKARSGAQHPAFEINLNGKGNLVMTDLRQGESLLVFSQEMTGRISIRDITSKLVLEVSKTSEKELSIGLEQGYYKLYFDDLSGLAETSLIVDEKKLYRLGLEDFQSIRRLPASARGPGAQESLAFIPLGLRYSYGSEAASLYLNLLWGSIDALDGLMFSLFFSRVTQSGQGVQLPSLFNSVEGRFKGVQLGVVNQVGEGMLGLQLGGFNLATGHLRGVQFGLINYSEEQTGVQVGLINISQKLNGLPLGLLDIQFNGENHIDLTALSAAETTSAANTDLYFGTYLRLGSEFLYKYLSFGTRAFYTGQEDYLPAISIGAGLGLRVPLFSKNFAVHLDGGLNYFTRDYGIDFRPDPILLKKLVPQARLFLSLKLMENFGFLAGINNFIYTKNFHTDFKPENKTVIYTDVGHFYIDTKFFLGIQI